MSGYLLDTNCISELVRPKPAPQVLKWFDAADERLLYLSVLTLGEIRKGIESLSPGKRKGSLETWLSVELPARFAGRILPLDAGVADRWGVLAAQSKRKGNPMPVIDGLLAATAIYHELTVVSRNATHFRGIQAGVVNPWE